MTTLPDLRVGDPVRHQALGVFPLLSAAVGDRVVAVDDFDKPETCRKVWDRLLTGAVMDALESGDPLRVAEPADVAALLSRVRSGPWEPAPAVGEGQEYRSRTDGTHASALVCDGSVLHGSVIAAS